MDKKVHCSKIVLETSNPVVSSLSAGGVSRNIAENLGRLGLSVKMLSVAGDESLWLEKNERFYRFSLVDRLPGKMTSIMIWSLQGDNVWLWQICGNL